MFTGLVAATGTVREADRSEAGGAWPSTPAALGAELAEGDSVAVNGVCLTATRGRRLLLRRRDGRDAAPLVAGPARARRAA